jgi:hypothetical protein
LKLDLSNYRTTRQDNERSSVEAIIATNPDWYWSLLGSLLESGYLPTENILVQKASGSRPSLLVVEGNRRVSALKLIHGFIPTDGLGVPKDLLQRMSAISQLWRKDNSRVPCAIYEPYESEVVKRIRSLTHGKGEKAGRDAWTAVARARHNRYENGGNEPALDLLEKYFTHGKNLTKRHGQQWAGDFPITVLDDAMKRIAPRLGLASGTELGKTYPKIKFRKEVETIIHAIGMQELRFEALRAKHKDVIATYGIPEKNDQEASSVVGTKGNTGVGSPSALFHGTAAAPPSNASLGGAAPDAAPSRDNRTAVPISDPRHVTRSLRTFRPRGAGREKVASLLDEAKVLKLDKTPFAFCFLLRSMFEISAKAYCDDYKASGLSYVKDGKDKKLVEVLRSVTTHLTNNSSDESKKRALHGALMEIGKPEGILSVTSMNHLVHNPKFSHQPGDIATLFGNVFPLLEAMNS